MKINSETIRAFAGEEESFAQEAKCQRRGNLLSLQVSDNSSLLSAINECVVDYMQMAPIVNRINWLCAEIITPSQYATFVSGRREDRDTDRRDTAPYAISNLPIVTSQMSALYRFLGDIFSYQRKQSVSQISSSYKAIREAETVNKDNGHENLGFLSEKSGFLPLEASRKKLPNDFDSWELLAENLPSEISNQTLRDSIEQLAELDATRIPDASLQRAASLLSILAHAYAHTSLDGVKAIPENLYKPWSVISNRLGRGDKPYMTYIDLIVFNWNIRSSCTGSNDYSQLSLDDIELLFPTVNNQEEQVFYLTQVEILAKTSKVVGNIALAQTHALNGNREGLIFALDSIQADLNKVQGSIRNINPMKSAKSYVDPIIWAKTVAPLAVPLEKGFPGPSGTSSPFFHMFDVFIGRKQYVSDLGVESIDIRRNFPPNWKRFISAVGDISLDKYIASSTDEELKDKWRNLKETYFGKILGVHKKKVFGYITHGFKTGRNNTIGGFEGNTRTDGASKVDAALDNSRLERDTASREAFAPNREVVKTNRSASMRNTNKNTVNVSQVVKNNGVCSPNHYFVASGVVYDAHSYLDRHPGGSSILSLSAGRDITNDLSRVSHLSGSTKKVLDRFAIGSLSEPAFKDIKMQSAYESAKALAFYLSEIETIYDQEVLLLDKKLTSDSAETSYSHYKKDLFSGVGVRFSKEFIPGIVSKFRGVIKQICLEGSCADKDRLNSEVNALAQRVANSDVIVKSSYMGFDSEKSTHFKRNQLAEEDLKKHVKDRRTFIAQVKVACVDLLESLEVLNHTSAVTDIDVSKLKHLSDIISRCQSFSL